MRKPKKEIQLTSYDELLGINEAEQNTLNQIVEVPLNELHPFRNHPFHVNDDEKKYAAYLTNLLRMSGFIVETDYLNRSLKAGFKQADRLNSKFTIVLNSSDLENNEVKIKNNKTKTEEIVNIDALIYYLDENLSDVSDCDCHDDNSKCDDECSCNHKCNCKD